MTLGNAIDRLWKECERARKKKIEKPITRALYETWKWADAYEDKHRKS